jgi:hypothetical protein
LWRRIGDSLLADHLGMTHLSISIEPADGVNRQPRIEINVVFPEPDGPRSKQVSPRLNERETSVNAFSDSAPSPYVFEIRWQLRMLVIGSVSGPEHGDRINAEDGTDRNHRSQHAGK